MPFKIYSEPPFLEGVSHIKAELDHVSVGHNVVLSLHSHQNLFYVCLDALGNCKCKTGCPACIGANVAGGDIKPEVVKLLRVITGV